MSEKEEMMRVSKQFKEEMMEAIQMGLPINPQWLEEKYAELWGENPAKMFSQGRQGKMQQGQEQPGQGKQPLPIQTKGKGLS